MFWEDALQHFTIEKTQKPIRKPMAEKETMASDVGEAQPVLSEESWQRPSQGKEELPHSVVESRELTAPDILHDLNNARLSKIQCEPKGKSIVAFDRSSTSSGHMSTSPDKGSSGSFLVELDLEMELKHDRLEARARALAPPKKCYILDLPIELLESICREYIDTTTATCLGLTCHSFFNITEHLYPYQVNLHMRTKGNDRKCLGHLLTDWMAPKYSFDHSWGKFLLKRHWRMDEETVDRRWREKENWRRIRLVHDKLGAVVAYEGFRGGF